MWKIFLAAVAALCLASPASAQHRYGGAYRYNYNYRVPTYRYNLYGVPYNYNYYLPPVTVYPQYDEGYLPAYPSYQYQYYTVPGYRYNYGWWRGTPWRR